jgi:transcriptional regulator GlxA family with amidase domain
MRMSIILFNGFTALDVVGGYEVLANLPGMEVECVSGRRGPVANDHGTLGLEAWESFDELGSTDILYVPGGPGVQAALADTSLIACVRRLAQASQWVVGICNGVEILGQAGLLEGREVTTNWFARERVAAYGARVRGERYVRDGQLITGAGVSSSIDVGLFMAGLLAGEDVAKTIQLGIEYYPQPPFGNAGPDHQPRQMQDVIASVERAAPARLARRGVAFQNSGRSRSGERGETR